MEEREREGGRRGVSLFVLGCTCRLKGEGSPRACLYVCAEEAGCEGWIAGEEAVGQFPGVSAPI